MQQEDELVAGVGENAREATADDDGDVRWHVVTMEDVDRNASGR
jgi:hypothetical protein